MTTRAVQAQRPIGSILAALAVGACTFDLERRDRPCERDAQCPDGQTCLIAESRCVARDATAGGDGSVADLAPDLAGRDGSVADLAPDLAGRDRGPFVDTALPADHGPDACQPVLCGSCGEGGTLVALPDDPACGTIDCDAKDEVFIDGTASATDTDYRKRRDYQDLETDRCLAPGQCKQPNGADCTEFNVVTLDSCGLCKRANLDGCQNYGDYTGCGGDDRCYGGICSTPCSTHNDGSVSCATLCGWCSGVCRGARTDDGRNVSCGDDGDPMTCYCTF